MGGAFHLLDRVDCGEGYDRGTMFKDRVDGSFNGGGIDQRADCVVDEDDIVVNAVEGCEGVRDGFLTVISAGDDVNLGGGAEETAMFGDLSLDAFDFVAAHGYINS